MNNTIYRAGGGEHVVEFHQLAGAGNRFLNNLLLGDVAVPPDVEAAGNLTEARAEWFADPLNGDLHLTAKASAVGKGRELTEVPDDFDGHRRPGEHDIGAHERTPR